jgi:hypothetical protein
MQATIYSPRAEELLTPLLASLPTASISPDPPTALLPILSPILRQRVQLLSASSKEPWLPLLCYDSSKAAKLQKAVEHERYEPHPVSGEVEIDWEYDVETRFKRIDEETLHAHLDLRDFSLSVQLVWCVNDEIGGGDGWRIGEVGIIEDGGAPWGEKSITQAEDAFESQTAQKLSTFNRTNGTNSLLTPDADEQEEDDDEYWAQYDNTPARTPAPKDTAPSLAMTSLQRDERAHKDTDEDSYYAQYASVQPAMDNHDPDEAQQNGEVESSLGRDEVTHELHHHLSATHSKSFTSDPDLHSSSLAWSDGQEPVFVESQMDGVEEVDSPLAQPRPASSTGSSGSDTVAKLERRAAASAMREQNELGIKQHIGTSIKSLYRLAKVAGIDRQEFERIVRTELECLALMDEDDM